jgi:hypothetical protein
VKALPYSRLTFRTASPAEVIAQRIVAIVATRRDWLTAPEEPFQGVVRGSHFKIQRVPGTFKRFSFFPVITGDIVQGVSGADVDVRFRLEAGDAVFMILWFGFVAYLTVDAVARRDTEQWRGTLAIVAAMATFGYGWMALSFWAQVRKARSLLRDALGLAESELFEN